MSAAKVVLYGRPGCHLCAEAREQIIEMCAREGWQIELEDVDIERDDDLLRRYLELIPVVTVEGEVVSELVLDEGALRAGVATVAGR